MKKLKKIFAILLIIISILSITTGLYLQLFMDKNIHEVESVPYAPLAYNTEKLRYLSDIEYIKEQSKVAWGSITLDQNLETSVNNGLISLIVDGNKKCFYKGVSAHATSTLIYDISEYDYDYFSTYYGVDAGRGTNGNGVKFYIYTSKDGENWDLQTLASPPVKKGNNEAEFIKINIKDVKYIKLYANNNGNQDSDHSVYADAKLFKEDYVEDTSNVDFIKTVEEYNNELKSLTASEILSNKEYVLLQREFVKNVGYDLLQSFVRYSDVNKETIAWLMNDIENLRLYIGGGKPDGSYVNSIKVLASLYENYKTDFDNKEVTKYGTVYGDLYKRMAIALSLTHSTNVGLWMSNASDKENQSDAVVRYQIYKDLHKNGKFVVSERQDHTKWFEEYKVEEMRYVMNNIIDDQEILWLNEYTQSFIDANPNKEEEYLQPHHYMKYVYPDYTRPEYYAEEYKEKWDEKYKGIFSKYGVSYGTGVQKLWMNIESGAVCGGISKIGSNIRAVHGTPSSVISQPGHAAIIYYRKNANGQGYWTIDNDVSGWAQSGKTERLSIRMPLGWGNGSYVNGWAATYIILAQEAINDYSNFEKAENLIMIADLYNDDNAKKEEILREALKTQSINIDAWWELIKLYKADTTKTEEDYYKLAQDLGNALMPFPLPMYNLLNQIKGKLTSNEYKFKYALLENKLLTEGKNYNSTDIVLQPNVTKTVATFLLGQTDNSLASFSFDGENAGKIVLSSRFDASGIRWDYSLDGKNKWNEVSFSADEEHKLQLTDKQINSINADDDIYIHIVGVNYDEDNLYKIDIKESSTPSNIYNNDLENRVIGATNTMEWRMISTEGKADSKWTSFKDEQPDLTGDKTVEVRYGKHGIYLESESVSLRYTKDKIDEKRKYISIDHLSISSVSSEATGQGRYARNAIDGNINTNWHSAWNGSDKEKYIVIKLDESKYLTAIDYIPQDGGNGRIKNASISVSNDGTTWTEVVSETNWAYNNETKTVDFNPIQAQYIKIVGKETQAASSSLSFIAARMINLYEDATKKDVPTANVEFSTTDKTNQDVTVTLINPSTEITITNNNNSNTYTFTDNGVFTFEFVDQNGNKGSTTAIVNWIDKVAPTASVEYSTTDKTTENVVVTLTNESEPITITNNDGKNTYTFTENGTFEFTYIDQAGNIGTTEVKVDWITQKEQTTDPEDNDKTGTEGEEEKNPSTEIDDDQEKNPTKPEENDDQDKDKPSETEVNPSTPEDNNKDYENNLYGNPEIVEVPDTGVTLIHSIIGLAITSFGICFVKHSSKDEII